MKALLQITLLALVSAVGLTACSEFYTDTTDVYYVHPHYRVERPVVVTTTRRVEGYRPLRRGYVPVPGPSMNAAVRPMNPATTYVRPMQKPQVRANVTPRSQPEANVSVGPMTPHMNSRIER